MPEIGDTHRTELATLLTTGTKVTVHRDEAQLQFTIEKRLERDNQASVIFEVSDSLGARNILKVIPAAEYEGKSLLDEVGEATNLSNELFAGIISFGELRLDQNGLANSYQCIVVEKIDGEDWAHYVAQNLLDVPTFVLLADQLCRALDALQRRKLSHDDLHPGNIMVEKFRDEFAEETRVRIKIIDTGTIKRTTSREELLVALKTKIETLKKGGGDSSTIQNLEKKLDWKTPDDHLRVVDALVMAANSLVEAYPKLDLWERKFVDGLEEFFRKCVDGDRSRRLDDPKQMLRTLNELRSHAQSATIEAKIIGPFDYISAEMIRDDKQFADLFSKECPWLGECEDIKPIYLYGPRGCGKSSVLRWLAFKTQSQKLGQDQLAGLRQVGVYVSCSVELRSKFWLFTSEYIDDHQAEIIRYFSLLLLEEFFDTLSLMFRLQKDNNYKFALQESDAADFAKVVEQRVGAPLSPRLQGLAHFDHLKHFARKLKWESWSNIQSGRNKGAVPDPSLIQDICRAVPKHFAWFNGRSVVFLLDDYSMQRIPAHLQQKLNQTISFAKQAAPVFKVSSEYLGVDLSGIQQGREVIEINVGERYMREETNANFLVDIIDRRLQAANYLGSIEKILGRSDYGGSMAKALVEESKEKPFNYYGIQCVHLLCSGDVALAINLISRLFELAGITKESVHSIEPSTQNKIIQQYAFEEVKRIRYLVPYGDEMYDIVYRLGILSRAHMKAKRSGRADKLGEPSCMTHIDIPTAVVAQLKSQDKTLYPLYEYLVSKAVLVSLRDSRSGDSKTTERLQIKRIYLPAFKSAPKRDVPLKLATLDELKSLLSNPNSFAQRQAKKGNIPDHELAEAMDVAVARPKGG